MFSFQSIEKIGKMNRVGIIAGFGEYPVLLASFLCQKDCEVYILRWST